MSIDLIDRWEASGEWVKKLDSKQSFFLRTNTSACILADLLNLGERNARRVVRLESEVTELQERVQQVEHERNQRGIDLSDVRRSHLAAARSQIASVSQDRDELKRKLAAAEKKVDNHSIESMLWHSICRVCLPYREGQIGPLDEWLRTTLAQLLKPQPPKLTAAEIVLAWLAAWPEQKGLPDHIAEAIRELAGSRRDT